jgi:hypothetical protein
MILHGRLWQTVGHGRGIVIHWAEQSLTEGRRPSVVLLVWC